MVVTGLEVSDDLRGCALGLLLRECFLSFVVHTKVDAATIREAIEAEWTLGAYTPVKVLYLSHSTVTDLY